MVLNSLRIWEKHVKSEGIEKHFQKQVLCLFEDYLVPKKQPSKDFECGARFLNKHDGENKLILIP